MSDLISKKDTLAKFDPVSDWSAYQIINGMPSAEKTGRIPVSERLPEDDGLYLVYTEEQPFVCPFENGEFFIDEVIAWMPLPPSYQEVADVLNKIRAEIEGELEQDNHSFYRAALEDVLKIIDKYRKGVSK